MKKNLTFKELIFVASMLFGMFFGAGNLIFPIFMGQLAGHHVWAASAGFLITGVGLPLLGVAALGVSQKDGLLELSSQIGRKYGVFFTCLLYLTIGPFFAIPRCATVSFTVGIEPFISDGGKMAGLGIFSFVFFAVVLFFSLKPGQIILALIFAVACLKTAIGLVTSCGETFEKIFPNGPSYRVWAVIFSLLSFLIANVGLDAIIAYSLPVLMFLYPLAVTLILLTLCGKLFGNDRRIYSWVTAFTAAAAILDFVKALPKNSDVIVKLQEMLGAVSKMLPMSKYGFGWVCPALVGLMIGLVLQKIRKNKR